jgi:uncharacterized protein YdcH (DUF465 family)
MHTDVLAQDAVVQAYERRLATQNHLSKDLQQRENTSTEQLVANIVELKKERLYLQNALYVASELLARKTQLL